MLGRKRKSDSMSVSFENDADEAQEPSRSRTHTPSSNPRARKTPRPSVEIIEIDSDEAPNDQQPRHAGPLRGLNEKNILLPTQTTIEVPDDEQTPERETQAARHLTRQSRSGRSEANYNMKYHPMDDVTRPKRAARQRSGSAIRDNEVETEDESLPSSARDTDSDQDADESESSGEAELPTQREPDPRASRHSGRKAAQKAVNYSTKHHPQDYGLPGYSHKAKQLKRNRDSGASQASRDSQQQESRTGTMEPGSDEAEHLLAEITQSKRPRKSLRSLEDGRQSTGKAKASKKSKQRRREETTGLPDMATDDIDEMVDMALKFSQIPQPEQNHNGQETYKASKQGVTKTPTSSACAKFEAAREALDQIPTSSVSRNAEEDPQGDLDRLEGLSSSPIDTGRAVSELDEGVFMVDDGHPPDMDGPPVETTNDELTTGSTPAVDKSHPFTKLLAGEEPSPPLYHGPTTNTQCLVDYSSSSSSGYMTGQDRPTNEALQEASDIANTICNGKAQDQLPPSALASSHSLARSRSPRTLAGSSHTGAPSPASPRKHQSEGLPQEHDTPSEFEEQFAVTERPHDAQPDAELDNRSSEGYYANLPVSDREWSDDHDAFSDASQSHKQFDDVRQHSLSPLSQLEAAADGFRRIHSQGRSRAASAAQEKYPSPITTLDGTGPRMLQDQTSEQRCRGGEEQLDPSLELALDLAQNDSASRHASNIATPPDSVGSKLSTEVQPTIRAGADLDDTLLEDYTASQSRQSNALLSSDPTIGDSDPAGVDDL